MTLYIAPVVEGQSEQKCIERLLHRVWNELLQAPDRLQVLPPSRGQRDALVKPASTELPKKLAEAHTKLTQKLNRDTTARGVLLVLLDTERDCPAALAPRLLADALKAQANADVACVFAKTMLENWIVAGASSLAGVSGLPDQLAVPSDPETGSGANWLKAQIRSRDKKRTYQKTADSLAFVEKMNLAGCRATAPSFDKLCRELEKRLPPPPPPEEPPPATEPEVPAAPLASSE